MPPRQSARRPADTPPVDAAPDDSSGPAASPDASERRTAGASSPDPASIGETPPRESGESDQLESLVAALRDAIGEEAYEAWFATHARLRLEWSGESPRLQIAAATPYLMGYLRRTFGRQVAAVLASVAAEPGTVDWQIDGAIAVELGGSSSDQSSDEAVAAEVQPRPSWERAARLDEFEVGTSNRTPWAIAQQFVSEAAGGRSLAYVYGGPGLGKTHLAEAVAGEVRRRHPRLRVLSMTAWDFGNDLGEAIAQRTTPSFRGRFRGVDVLVLDNVCFFDGPRKESFQLGLLQTLDRLQQDGKAVFLTASQHPQMLTKTSKDLVDRLAGGNLGRLAEPDETLRRKIVRAHAKELGLTITPAVVDYVADRFRRSIRQVQGALNTLANEVRAEEQLEWLSAAEAEGRLFEYCPKPTGRVGITKAREILASLERDVTPVVKLADIVRAVGETFGVSAGDLAGPGRARRLSRPRQFAIYLARKLTPAAYKEIGDHFGGRNHSTVMAAERAVRKLIAESESVRAGATDWAAGELAGDLERRLTAG